MKKITFLFNLLFLLNILVYSQNQYSITKNLKPIKIEYKEFMDIVSGLNVLVEKFDTLYENSGQTISFENKDTRQTIENLNQNDILTLNKAYSVNYQYSNYKGAISKINIYLHDSNREILISGSNMIELESLLNFLEKELNAKKTAFGGLKFRIFLGISLLLITFLIYSSHTFVLKGTNIVFREKKSNKTLIIAIVLWIFTMLCMWGVFNFEYVFPGFLIYSENTGFITKYADHFTFWSFIFAILIYFVQNIRSAKQ